LYGEGAAVANDDVGGRRGHEFEGWSKGEAVAQGAGGRDRGFGEGEVYGLGAGVGGDDLQADLIAHVAEDGEEKAAVLQHESFDGVVVAIEVERADEGAWVGDGAGHAADFDGGFAVGEAEQDAVEVDGGAVDGGPSCKGSLYETNWVQIHGINLWKYSSCGAASANR
jgi:hypothetical protein